MPKSLYHLCLDDLYGDFEDLEQDADNSDTGDGSNQSDDEKADQEDELPVDGKFSFEI